MIKRLSALILLSLLAGPAFAADLLPTRKEPSAPIITPPTWTGFYIGVMGGYATGPARETPNAAFTDLGAYPVGYTVDGGFVGGQIGYDYEFADSFVLGAVGDIAWAGLKGKACAQIGGPCTGDPTDSYAVTDVNWLATIRGKAGFAVTPDALLYATGGVAFAGTHNVGTNIDFDGVSNVTGDGTHVGWAVGVGGEYKLTRQVSFGLEYLYADLGKQSYSFSFPDYSGVGSAVDLKLNIFKGALNYHF